MYNSHLSTGSIMCKRWRCQLQPDVQHLQQARSRHLPPLCSSARYSRHRARRASTQTQRKSCIGERLGNRRTTGAPRPMARRELQDCVAAAGVQQA